MPAIWNSAASASSKPSWPTRKLRTRAFTSAGNKSWGNRPFSRGHLYYLLSNPIYAGKIAHKDERYRGPARADHRQEDLRRRAGAACRQYTAAIRKSPRQGAKPAGGPSGRRPGHQAHLLPRCERRQALPLLCRHAHRAGPIEAMAPAGARHRSPQSSESCSVSSATVSGSRELSDRGRSRPHELKEALWTAKQLATRIGKTVASRETILKLVKQVRVSESEITVEIQLAVMCPIEPYRADMPSIGSRYRSS